MIAAPIRPISKGLSVKRMKRFMRRQGPRRERWLTGVGNTFAGGTLGIVLGAVTISLQCGQGHGWPANEAETLMVWPQNGQGK
jgi:hypothetical protein